MASAPFATSYGPGRGGLGGPLGLPVWLGLPVVLIAAAGCGLLAFLISQQDLRAQAMAAGGLGVVLGVLLVRERPLMVLLVLLLAMEFPVVKAIGPIRVGPSGGPPSIYITPVDLLVLVLYGMWLFEGSLGRDLRRAARRPLLLVPLAGIVATLPSLLVAQDLTLAAAELVRQASTFALYVYVALRVRSRREVAFIVGALFVVAAIQAAVAALQWRSGGTLGLWFLGEESSLGVRELDEGEIPRPTGTLLHPGFLSLLLGSIALIALSLAINLRRFRVRLICLVTAAVSVAPMIINEARAALLAWGAGCALLLGISLWRRRLAWRALGLAAAVLGMAAVPFHARIIELVNNNFFTDHFQFELEARLELNQLALNMIRDAPVVGVGLHNFETVLQRYDVYGVIYQGYPTHHFYLLTLSETGVVGLLGLIATLLGFLVVAARLAWGRDRLLSGIGMAVVASLVFFYVEELSGYSLRHDPPRTMLWLLAGLSVACWRMARAGAGQRHSSPWRDTRAP